MKGVKPEDKCGAAFPKTVQCYVQRRSCNSSDDPGARQYWTFNGKHQWRGEEGRALNKT